MRKLWILGVIGALALLPFAALADTGGSASATLTFDSVINTIVTDNWDDLTVNQDMIENWLNLTADTPVIWGGTEINHSITVKVQAFTAFTVYASYEGSPGPDTDFTLPDDLNDKDSFLYLSNGTTDFALKWYRIDTPTNHGLTDAQASANLTQLDDWTGSATINGEEHTYDVKWDPSELPDLDAGDSMSLTIYIVVTDPNA